MRNGIDYDEMEIVADVLSGSDGMHNCICNPPDLENCPCTPCRVRRYLVDTDPNGPWRKATEETTCE